MKATIGKIAAAIVTQVIIHVAVAKLTAVFLKEELKNKS